MWAHLAQCSRMYLSDLAGHIPLYGPAALEDGCNLWVTAWPSGLERAEYGGLKLSKPGALQGEWMAACFMAGITVQGNSEACRKGGMRNINTRLAGVSQRSECKWLSMGGKFNACTM